MAAQVLDIDVEPETIVPEMLPNFRMGRADYDEEEKEENEECVPEALQSLILSFRSHVQSNNPSEILSAYDSAFSNLFKYPSWPSVESLAPAVDNDQVFLVLYKELYYRLLYSRREPAPTVTPQQRLESWQNYKALFSLLSDTSRPEIALPAQWLWDMIDEFVFQFQSNCQYHAQILGKSEQEISFIKNHPEAWNVAGVLKQLETFVSASGILGLLREHQQQQQPSYTVHQTLGYFSIIGLLRIHVLLGDYNSALKAVEPIDLSRGKGLFVHVTAAHIALYYYLGFAFLMTRRYVAAIKALTTILLFISRTKQYHTRSYQYGQMNKKNEQMYYLLAIAVSLSPQRITDEIIDQTLHDKCSDRMFRIQRGDVSAFRELFKGSCPKFILPAPLDTSGRASEEELHASQKAAYEHQVKRFMHEVEQQCIIRTVRSYLKLYTTISVSKLAGFLDVDETTLRANLLCYKHKTRNLGWNGASPLQGDWISSSDIEFHVDKDMISIADTKVTRRFGEYFIRNINRFDQDIQSLSRQKGTATQKV